MIKRFLICVSCLVTLLPTVWPVKASDTPKAPFLYYYSAAKNAFVIERADGTESRLLGQGIMPPDHTDATEAQWSPSGQWLVWMSNKLASAHIIETTPFILNRDGKTRLTLLDRIKGIELLQWSPVSDIVMAWANEIDWSASRSYIHIYLIDVSAQKIITAVTRQSESQVYETRISWSKDGRTIQLTYQAEQNSVPTDYYLLTLSLDGQSTDHQIAVPSQTSDARLQQWWPGDSWNAYLDSDTKTLNIESANNSSRALRLTVPETPLKYIVWNPDGIHASVFAGEDLWLLTLPNGTFTRVQDGVVLPLDDIDSIVRTLPWQGERIKNTQ